MCRLHRLHGRRSRDTRVFCYLEWVKNADLFKAACARARDAGKPVIVFKLGSSAEGREAAMTHTGALRAPRRRSTR